MLDIRKFVLLTSACTLILSGCTTLNPDKKTGYEQELQGQTAIYSWTARGQMLFSCAHDEAGFFWRFVRSEGRLSNDAGNSMGKINPDLSITSTDGSKILLRPLKAAEAKAPGDLKNLLYAVDSSPQTGIFARISFVERRNAKGGLPLSKCSAIQNQQLLHVPFEARYIFWR